MELILVLLGLGFIAASFILASRQRQDYLRVQEEMMENVVNASVLELQNLKSELSEELVAKYEELSDDLEAKAKILAQDDQLKNVTEQPEVGQVKGENSSERPNDQVQDLSKSRISMGEWEQRERLVREMH